MKPVVDISNCNIVTDSIGRERLTGVVHNYPEDHMYRPKAVVNGLPVTTSPIINKTTEQVETLRTVYNILSWSK